MSWLEENIHGTAIVVDGIGMLFIGESGAGKSSMAFDCMAQAKLEGLVAALIGDDRVLVRQCGDRVMAGGPQSIQGMIELRYSGIVSVNHVEEAELHIAIQPVTGGEGMRLPPDHERVAITAFSDLPLICVPVWSRFPLSVILAKMRKSVTL